MEKLNKNFNQATFKTPLFAAGDEFEGMNVLAYRQNDGSKILVGIDAKTGAWLANAVRVSHEEYRELRASWFKDCVNDYDSSATDRALASLGI